MQIDNRGNVPEKIIKKECEFYDCFKTYEGTGHSKYCHEHRKQKYRKIIDAEKNEQRKEEQKLRNINQVIKHSNDECKIIKLICVTCGKEFEVLMIPNVYVYPRNCEEHRNYYKRQLYLESIQHEQIQI